MTAREKLLQQFEKEYNKLNAQQRQAVDKIYGPVMVVAGPGTGKTQILSVRIGKILLDTDYLPSNILCLTYTDAGVLAMRKRLLTMIGPDAYTVNIHSFHSFCNMVIQQNRHLFHHKDLQPINELEQQQCLVELIDSFDGDNPLKRYKNDAYYEAGALRDLFSAMKREGWKADWLVQRIDEYVETIPDNFYNKTKYKKGIIELTVDGKKELEKMEKVKAAVKAFPRYQEILRARQRYDFDDMITWVIEAFETNADLLLGYQEQFQFLLVDEYQDTSGSQNRLVELLISYWQDESPNIFVVGDDDQSIFRFQGANMENMMLLAKKYEQDLLRVVLTSNYRSTQPILDLAHHLITHNTQRLVNEYDDLEKVLTAAREEYKELNVLPAVRTVNNEFEENILIAEEIRQLVDEGVLPGRIAVIYKEHRTGDELQKFLQLQGVPYYTKRSVNLLKESFIRKLLSFLKYTLAEADQPFSGDPTLFEILHYDFFSIPALKIALVSNQVAQNQRARKEPNSLRGYLAQLSQESKSLLFSGDAATDALVAVHKSLEKLISESHNLPLLRWVELLLNEGNILSYIMQHPEKAWLMKQLNGFFDYVKDECRRNPDLTLKGLVRQIELLEENGISIPLVQTSGTELGVNLLTCHGSKGLEYEYVFFVGCYSGLWEGKTKRSNGYKLPPNVFEKVSAQENEEELRRLFFVAATRAEKHLYLSFPAYTNEGKALEASRFIAEMNAEGALAVEKVTLDETTKLKYAQLRYGLIEKPQLEAAEKNYIDNLLSNFRMNVTALNNFLECPVRFYYNSLMRVPSASSENAQFGSSMHDALNYFHIKMMEDKKWPGVEMLVSRFQWHINHHREVFTETSLKRLTEYGSKCLVDLYNQKYAHLAGGDFIRTEVPMEAVVNGIPLRGFADKIQYWGNEISITDFKTGSLEKSQRRWEFAEAGHPRKPEGGNYWRQAVFYKILSDHQKGKKKEIRSIQFEYIEPNKEDKFDVQPVLVTPAAEAVVQQQISETWEKIKAHDFYTGCGKPECHWCNFVKEHKVYAELIEEEVESGIESPESGVMSEA